MTEDAKRGRGIAILGIFAADLSFRTPRLPQWGETVLGNEFRLGPGGKGSNQAVAAARLGGAVSFITRIGRDSFGEMAQALYRAEGIDTRHVMLSDGLGTGAAAILVDAAGENAIVVVPGAAAALSSADIAGCAATIAGARLFMTQLETPVPLAAEALGLARRAGVMTILNPAPAAPLDDSVLALVDCLTPNESEAAALTGMRIESVEDAKDAAGRLLARGPRAVVLTLGAEGALVCAEGETTLVPAVAAGPLVDTTGAGDAFNGGLAVALAEGQDLVAAARFGCAVAGISVTRAGTAPSMPSRAEVMALIGRSR